MPPSLSKAEKEHILRWDDDPEGEFNVFTHREKVAKRLLKGGAKLIRESKIGGKVVAWALRCPREWVKWPTARKKRNLTPEQRLAASKRLQDRNGGRKSPVDKGKTDPDGGD